MDAFLGQAFERLLDHTNLSFKRYLYANFRLSRLAGLIGPRGVGKTTLMLQYIKEHLAADRKTFYFSADSVYFRKTTLVEFIHELYNLEGYRIFFIDEIHKYAHWSQELKNIYDAFPDVKIVYSGSSALELIKGTHDLSRRAKLYHLPGLSFREYLNFVEKERLEKISLTELLKDPTQFNTLSTTNRLLGYFKEYLCSGYYPFVFEDSHTYHERVMRIIEKIIFEDIPSCFDLKTQNLHLFQKILGYLASIPPGEVNTHNIAKNIGASDQTIFHYLNILSSVGLIQMIYSFGGGNTTLRKPQKIFLHNTTLLYACQQLMGKPLHQGTLRELYFIQALRDGNQPVYYSEKGDYQTHNFIVEIGGKNKKTKQISSTSLPAYLVKDDILVASKQSIPLLFFGFIY